MNEISMEGMIGEPLPYLLRTDGMVTCILFCCMVLLSYVLAKGNKYLYHQLKSFATSRERASMFDEVTVSDIRYTALLLFHSCLLIGFCIYYFLSATSPDLFFVTSHGYLLASIVGGISVFLLLKYLLYSFVNWVFFQKARNLLWVSAYLNVIVWIGLFLFPVILLVVYFGLSLHTAAYLVGAIIIFAKIALFYKCFSNFFGNIHGLVHLILYFCALEILPDLIMWKGIETVSNNLILNI